MATAKTTATVTLARMKTGTTMANTTTVATTTTMQYAAGGKAGWGPAGTRMPRSCRRWHTVVAAHCPFTPEFVVLGALLTAGPPLAPFPLASRPPRSTPIPSSPRRCQDGRANGGATPTSTSPCAKMTSSCPSTSTPAKCGWRCASTRRWPRTRGASGAMCQPQGWRCSGWAKTCSSGGDAST